MTVEGIIDAIALPNANDGDINVGDCKSEVVGFMKDGVNVKVTPDPVVCGGCKLSEFCTESKAD